jgi:hypothetical protein
MHTKPSQSTIQVDPLGCECFETVAGIQNSTLENNSTLTEKQSDLENILLDSVLSSTCILDKSNTSYIAKCLTIAVVTVPLVVMTGAFLYLSLASNTVQS